MQSRLTHIVCVPTRPACAFEFDAEMPPPAEHYYMHKVICDDETTMSGSKHPEVQEYLAGLAGKAKNVTGI